MWVKLLTLRRQVDIAEERLPGWLEQDGSRAGEMPGPQGPWSPALARSFAFSLALSLRSLQALRRPSYSNRTCFMGLVSR